MRTELPWQRVERRKPDMTLDVSSDNKRNVFLCRRARPSEPNAGWFVVLHNDVRISSQRHEFMPDALAEAEAYFYSLPEFSKSATAQAFTAMRGIGEADFNDGVPIVKGVGQYDGSARTNWVTGWLTGYGKQVTATIQKSIMATVQANNQLEHDLAITTHRNSVLIMVYEFAITLDTRASAFLKDFIVNPESLNDNWPEWIAFKAQRAGASPDDHTKH